MIVEDVCTWKNKHIGRPCLESQNHAQGQKKIIDDHLWYTHKVKTLMCKIVNNCLDLQRSIFDLLVCVNTINIKETMYVSSCIKTGTLS